MGPGGRAKGLGRQKAARRENGSMRALWLETPWLMQLVALPGRLKESQRELKKEGNKNATKVKSPKNTFPLNAGPHMTRRRSLVNTKVFR
jgi:hypothetical protein